MPILNRAAEMQDEVAGWRRHLHSNPELNFDVFKTAGFVDRQAQGIRLRRGGDRASAAPASSASSAAGTAKAAPSACAPTWTRCRSPRATGKPYASTRARRHACLRP